MNSTQNFKYFLESLKGRGHDELIETVERGFSAVHEGINWDIVRKTQWPKAVPLKHYIDDVDVIIDWDYDHDEDGITVYLEKVVTTSTKKDVLPLLNESQKAGLQETCEEYVNKNYKSDQEVREGYADYQMDRIKDRDL